MEKQFTEQILTFGAYKGKMIKDTPVRYQNSLEAENKRRHFLAWFDIIETPAEALIKDTVVFDSQVTYENDLQVGTLRGFIVGDPIVEIFNGDVTLFNRSGWINLKDRDISLKVKRGHIKKVKDNA
tara:strand:+ start:299 stop:676 length:378 start_codon:yes stop_codon:yes gene_type:complete